MKVYDLPTPALLVYESVLKKNAKAMQALADGSGLKLRPHFKSHKCASLAHMQIEYGAKGMTCAKLSEAEDLADAGINDILIANQIVEPEKIERVARLAAKCRITVLADCEENLLMLARAARFCGSDIGIYIEYEIGMQRCGVSDKAEALRLARLINSEKGLTLRGIQAYAGHLSHEADAKKREEATLKNHKRIRELVSYLEENGVKIDEISGASTGTAAIKAREGLYTELQAGSYLFMDATYSELGLEFENSLFILTTVVSVSENLAVVDCGIKTCGVDQGMPKPKDFECDFIVDSEEHLQIHSPKAELKVGDKILLVPAHCCSTINLHEKIYLVDGDEMINRISVSGRGYGR